VKGVIYLPFALSVVLAGLSRLACRRTSPRPAAWSVTVAMVLLAGSTVGAFVLLAWPLAARLPLVAHVGGWRPGAVDHGVPVPAAVSILAAIALGLVAVAAVGQARRLRRDLVDIGTMHAGLRSVGTTGVVVVDDPLPRAHALPATLVHPGVVVVTSGLLDVLDDEERAAVVAHEHAHLANGHRTLVVVAGLAAGMNPLLRLSRDDLAFALERWADEDAAGRTSRIVTARALTKGALAKLSSAHDRIAAAGVPNPAMGFGHLGVPQRIAALLEPEADRRRVGLAWLIGGLALVGMAAIAWASRDTEHLFELLRTH